MSAQGTQRHSSASQSKGIVIRSTTTPYSGELPLLIRSNISQKYTARGRGQFSFRDWLPYGSETWQSARAKGQGLLHTMHGEGHPKAVEPKP